MAPDVYTLIARAKAGDSEAQAALVEGNTGLVWSVVKKFQNRGHEAEDLFQVGSIGLIKAIQKFDTSFQVQFSTYAVPMIMGEIKRFIRDDGIIKVSRSLKELAGKARNMSEQLQRELGRSPTVHEIAQKLGVDAEELVMAMEANAAPDSLNAIQSDDNRELMEKVDEGTNEESQIVERLALQSALASFPPRERQIIVLRYFSCKTQTQVAKMLGISQVQVSRIEKKVLGEMRKKLSG